MENISEELKNLENDLDKTIAERKKRDEFIVGCLRGVRRNNAEAKIKLDAMIHKAAAVKQEIEENRAELERIEREESEKKKKNLAAVGIGGALLIIGSTVISQLTDLK